jgi:hypothetical protein
MSPCADFRKSNSCITLSEKEIDGPREQHAQA